MPADERGPRPPAGPAASTPTGPASRPWPSRSRAVRAGAGLDAPWSYSRRVRWFDSTPYAATSSLNCAAASGSSLVSGCSCLARLAERAGDVVAARPTRRRRAPRRDRCRPGAPVGTAPSYRRGSVVLQRDRVGRDVHLRHVLAARRRRGPRRGTSPAAPAAHAGHGPANRSIVSAPQRRHGIASGGNEAGSKCTSPRGIRASSRARAARVGDRRRGRGQRDQADTRANSVAYRVRTRGPPCSAIEVEERRGRRCPTCAR